MTILPAACAAGPAMLIPPAAAAIAATASSQRRVFIAISSPYRLSARAGAFCSLRQAAILFFIRVIHANPVADRSFLSRRSGIDLQVKLLRIDGGRAAQVRFGERHGGERDARGDADVVDDVVDVALR